MTQIQSSLIEKIQKLLRLSGSNNQHEAELALSKAKQLAVENEINLASINVWEKLDEKYELGYLDSGKRASICSHYVAWILNSYFNVKIIYTGGRLTGRKIAFIGKKQDIEISQYIYSYLINTIMSLWRNYMLKTGVGCDARNSWMYGCYMGLNSKLEESKKQAEENKFNEINISKPEESQEIKQRYSLMVVNNKEKLQKATEDFFPSLKNGAKKSLNLSDLDAYSNGITSGRNINLNRGATNSSTKVIA